MPTILGQNQYGKAENRVVKITRDGGTHHLRDLNVSVALSGDLDEVHYSGSNAHVLPTDTTKNTVFAFAKQHGIESAESFGILLARHFVDDCAPITTARIRIEEYAWERIGTPPADSPSANSPSADASSARSPSVKSSSVNSSSAEAEEAGHSFVRKGQETRTAQITYDGESVEVLSGLKDLTVLNSTHSEFWGYLKDQYTTLQEDYDRILATDVASVWRHEWTGAAGEREPHWDDSYARAKKHMLHAFAETYSLSLQQTLYQMGARVIDNLPGIAEIRFSMPNKHHFKVDLTPFGLKNEAADGAVYYAADRPYGLIEATVLRDGATPRIPLDTTNL